MLVTYLATCNSSFMADGFPATEPALKINFTSDTALPSSPYQSVLSPFLDAGFSFTNPVAPRCWGDLNGGKLLWPVLDGYKLVEKRREQRKAERRRVLAARNLPAKEEAEHATLDEAQPITHNGDDEHFDPLVIDLEAEASQAEAPDPEAEQVPSDDTASATARKPTASPVRKSWFWNSNTPTAPDAPPPLPPAEPSAFEDMLEVIPLPPPKRIQASDDTMYVFGMPIRRRWDLRYKSIGLVLDFSNGRTEQAVRQEVEQWIDWEDQVALEKWADEDEAKVAETEAMARSRPPEVEESGTQDPPLAPRGWPWSRSLSRAQRGEAAQTEQHRHSGIEHLRLVEL